MSTFCRTLNTSAMKSTLHNIRNTAARDKWPKRSDVANEYMTSIANSRSGIQVAKQSLAGILG